MIVLMAFVSPNYFSYSTLTGLMTQIAIYGIVACGHDDGDYRRGI